MKNLKKIPFQQRPIFSYLLLALFAFITYWPISLNLFSLKNDAIVYFLPYRYNISYAIQQGEFPFWSPYLYMGFPLHADMQSGSWNPIVLLISLFTTYNMTLLQVESLLYIFLAGVGMWKLLKLFVKDHNTSLVFACCYMACGFITDSGQFIVWIASAAFVPFVFLYYYRLLRDEKLGDLFKCAIAIFFLLVAGYPSFLLYTLYIVFFGLVCNIVYRLKKKNLNARTFLRIVGMNLLLALLFGLLAAPAIVSYLEFIPHFARGTAVSIASAQTNPFCINCSLSYLFPFSVTRRISLFETDTTMRNAYVGVFTLVFATYGLTRKLSSFEIFVFVVTVLSFLFSLGDATPVREWAYSILPGMNFFRHPGNMRLFTSIGLILFAAVNFQKIAVLVSIFSLNKLRIIAIGLIIICVVFIVFNVSEFGSRGLSQSSANPRGGLQDWFNNLSLNQILVIESVVQLLFLIPFLIFLKKLKKQFVYALIISNSFVFMQPSLASTFVGKASPAEVNQFVGQNLRDDAIKNLHYSLRENRMNDALVDGRRYGYPSWYNKRISDPIDVFTPAYLKQQMSFSGDSLLREKTWTYTPVVILNDTAQENAIGPNVKPIKFSTTDFSFSLHTDHESKLGIVQNHYIHWRAYLDDKETPVFIWNKAFMSIKIPAGDHIVRFQYRPGNIITLIYVSLSIWLFSMGALIFFYFRKQK